MRVFPFRKANLYLYPLLAATVLRLAALPFIDLSTKALLEYGIIARNLLAGLGYSFSWLHTDSSIVVLPTAYMPPGQVFIHYGILSVFGESSVGVIALYIFQIIQVCAFIYLIGKISALLFDSKKATLTTIWLAAIYPPFIYVTMTFGVTSSALLLNALVLYIGVRFSEALRSGRNYKKLTLAFGGCCGLLLLFRGESPIIILGTLALILYSNRDKLRRSLLWISFGGLTSLAILSPWIIRNYIEFDRFIPISTNSGFNFWRGNNPQSSGSAWTESGGPLWSSDEIWHELEPYLDQKGDYDKINSEVHSREAWKWIRENPTVAGLLSLKKAAILWTVDIRNKMGGTFAYIILYGLTLASLIVGIYYVRRNKVSQTNENARIGFQIMILWCILMTIISMIFFPLPRFQVLLIGIYFPIIGYGVSELTERYFPKQKS